MWDSLRLVDRIANADLYAFRSMNRYSGTSWACDNGMFYAEAGNPALEIAIEWLSRVSQISITVRLHYVLLALLCGEVLLLHLSAKEMSDIVFEIAMS